MAGKRSLHLPGPKKPGPRKTSKSDRGSKQKVLGQDGAIILWDECLESGEAGGVKNQPAPTGVKKGPKGRHE